jgi:hypothetical protein
MGNSQTLLQPGETLGTPVPASDASLLQPGETLGAPSAPSAPEFSISAQRQPTTMLGKLGQWADDISDDIKYGTDHTGIGSVLKAMGARGVYAGNSQEVGEFMASLPLGLLKAAKGATQLAPHEIGGPEGKTWEGVKNLGGGLLQAATLPASFVAPEASPLSKEGLLADAAEAIPRAAKAVSAPIREGAAQPALQAGIRSTAATVAKEAEVAAPLSPSLYKTFQEAGDAVLAKSKGQYATLDAATGGRFQRFTDQLSNIRQKLNELTGTEEDVQKEAALLKSQRESEAGMEAAFEDAKAAGVDPALVDEASANWKQGQALHDLDTAVFRSTTGKPAGVGEKGLPEMVDPRKLAPRVTALWKSGRLEQAIGPENSVDLIDVVGTAAKHQQTVMRTKVFLKVGLWGLGLAGLAGGAGAAIAHKLAGE